MTTRKSGKMGAISRERSKQFIRRAGPATPTFKEQGYQNQILKDKAFHRIHLIRSRSRRCFQADVQRKVA